MDRKLVQKEIKNKTEKEMNVKNLFTFKININKICKFFKRRRKLWKS